MKARLIVDATGPNPSFSPPKNATPGEYAAYQRDVPHTIPRPVGTVVEGRMAYLLCRPDFNGVVLAEPADEECEKVHRAWLEKVNATETPADVMEAAHV